MSTFHLPSAKSLTRDRAVQVFVPTQLFWEVLESDQHEVIFGTRGSGKTMLLRMLSVSHLSEFALIDERAKRLLVEEKRFGLFLPLGIDWCVALGPRGEFVERRFLDGINLVVCEVLVEVLGQVAGLLVPKERSVTTEAALAEELKEQWFRPGVERATSLLGLERLLLRHQSTLRDLWRDGRAPTPEDERSGEYFFKAGDLFSPLSDALKIANRHLGLGADHKWLLGLDELEDLRREQLELVITLLRSTVQNIVIKATTQPYSLDGIQSKFPGGVPAAQIRDYHPRRLQYDPYGSEFQRLAGRVLAKKLGRPDGDAAVVGPEVFGVSTFQDRALKADGDGFGITRSRLKTENNKDSARKKLPVAAIRALRRRGEGNAKPGAYSGWPTIVAVSDGNLGMFVRLMNEFEIEPGTSTIHEVRQHEVLIELADQWHKWSQGLYTDGRLLHDLINQLGIQLKEKLHCRLKDETDVQEEIGRFEVDLGALDSSLARAFIVGAQHALFSAESESSLQAYPSGEGLWRLSYALAPKFWLLPRRGRPIRFGPVPTQMAFDFVLTEPPTREYQSVELSGESAEDEI